MSLAEYLSFIVTCIIIESTPGPNMAYLAVLSASEGRKAGFFAVLGIALGLLIVGVLAALGLAALISSSELAYQLLRWGGIAYLLWLAWDGWKEEPETSPHKIDGRQQRQKFFKRGLLVNLLNPKAAVFYIAILPGFVNLSNSVTLQTIALTVTFVAIATFIHLFIVGMAGTAQEFLQDRKRRLMVRRILSLALGVIAIWFGFETARNTE